MSQPLSQPTSSQPLAASQPLSQTQPMTTHGIIKGATEEDITKLKKIVNDIKFGMLTTIDDEGMMHSRPMGVSGELECVGGQAIMWFFTRGKSLKMLEMSKHQNMVNVSFGHPAHHTYLSVSGSGALCQDRAEMQKRWNSNLLAWFPKGLDEPDIALLKVVLLKAEYWDAPSSLMSHAFSFVKSHLGVAGAAPADVMQHKAISLDATGGSQGKAEKKVTQKEHTMQDERDEPTRSMGSDVPHFLFDCQEQMRGEEAKQVHI